MGVIGTPLDAVGIKRWALGMKHEGNIRQRPGKVRLTFWNMGSVRYHWYLCAL